MDSLSETIVAPITGAHKAPVALVRVSGPRAWEIAKAVFPSVGAEPRHLYFGSIEWDGKQIDEGFLTLFEEGHSYTEEESFELSCHGSPEIVAEVIDAIVANGARVARPGEFTERAFLNGRIDLTQAEAVRETIDASTAAQVRRAGLLREGKLSKEVEALSETVGRVLAMVEATTDFSDEIGELDRGRCAQSLSNVVADLDRLIAGAATARLIRSGMRIAIVGRPNVGKSSFLNALLGMERAIVTDVPGTTRDTIEESASIAGYPVVLTDTAGIRQTDDKVEAIGVERSRGAIESADEVWLVYESHTGWTEADELLRLSLAREPDLLVANKCDLGAKEENKGRPVSSLKSEGLEGIADHVKQSFRETVDLPLVNDRHVADLQAAKQFAVNAIATLTTGMPTDLASVDLQGAMKSLGRITGWSAPDEVLERIFRDFCIGK